MRIAQFPMDGSTRQRTRRRSLSERALWLWMGLALLTILNPARRGSADEHVEGFDDSRPTWTLRISEGSVENVTHERVTSGMHRGSGAEHFAFRVARGPTTVILDHKLPVARAIDDLHLKLMVRSTTNGPTIGMRVVFPRQTDPRSDLSLAQQLKLTLHGEKYTQTGKWQSLEVRVTEKALQDQMRLLRAKLKPAALDLRDPVVDRVILELTLGSGETELFLDDLSFGPIVRPVAAADAKEIQQTQFDADSIPWPVTFQLDRLLVRGRPFFPRVLPYHDERIIELRDAGFNVIWIPDAGNVDLQRSLKGEGLFAMAVPPRVQSSTGEAIREDDASLPPIPREWDNILAWTLGNAMPPDAREALQWLTHVQSADRDRHRPILADVLGGERIYSRHVAMLSCSRNVLNSGQSFKTYRESLDQRRKLARPGTFLFTWLPTEPLPEIAWQRQAAGRIPMIIEPEQLRLSAYSALAAGCRGLGFSLSESLESTAPGADERRLAISQLNLELELFEDILAAGTLIEQRPFEITAPLGSGVGLHNVGFRNSAISRADSDARRAARTSSLRREARLRSELEAAVFRTDKAVLLLPIWYEHDAQFVPGQLAAPGATIDVASVPDTASAWEITTTRVVNLPSEPIPGGRRVKLPTFDTTAAIIVTSDRSLIESLRRKMESMQAQSARLWIELAKAKLNRVRIADEELTKLGVGQPDAPQLLTRARQLLQEAEGSFPGEELDRVIAQARQSGQKASSNSPDVVLLKTKFDKAAQRSQASLQALRILQKAHWQTATQRLGPIGSPHTLCFQTLPDHWRLIANLGKSATRDSVNLLPKGDFEVLDFAALTHCGWQSVPTRVPTGIRAAVQVLAASGRDSRCLRLVAAPETNTDPPNIVDTPPITIVSPAIPVRAGQILHISGLVRIGSPITGSLNGVTLSDSLTGLTGAWHWTEKREWQKEKFEMLREVYQDGDFSLIITLHGIGDVQFDDLQVIAHDLPEPSPLATSPNSKNDPSVKPSRYDFWQRLPRFPQRK